MVDDLVILYRFVSKTEITEWLVKCYDKQISRRERGWGRGELGIKRPQNNIVVIQEL